MISRSPETRHQSPSAKVEQQQTLKSAPTFSSHGSLSVALAATDDVFERLSIPAYRTLARVKPSLRAAYCPETFRAAGHAVVELLAEHLKEAQAGQVFPVKPTQQPHQQLAALPRLSKSAGERSVPEWISAVLDGSTKIHHPHFLAHQVCAPMPQAALFELLAATTNNGMAIFEMGPIQSAMEHEVLRFLAAYLGYDENAGGVMTHGGSLGNLTALLAARQAWLTRHPQAHADQPPKLVILVSQQAHYCIARAAQIMGLGVEGCEPVACDAQYRMDPQDLAAALARVHARGGSVFAVVANAGSTSTGSFDPLHQVADFCRDNNLWMHVDGAHGASLCLVDSLRHLIAGIERSDSVVWDTHKMMMMPALNTVVLFADRQSNARAFAQKAAYLYEDEQASLASWLDIGQRTVECTKRPMGVTLYTALATCGIDVFVDYIESCCATARAFARAVESHPQFELACDVACNIVCFRFLFADATAATIDGLTRKLRSHLIEDGHYYLGQTTLRDRVYLRIVVMSPQTSVAHVLALLQEIERQAQTLVPEASSKLHLENNQ